MIFDVDGTIRAVHHFGVDDALFLEVELSVLKLKFCHYQPLH